MIIPASDGADLQEFSETHRPEQLHLNGFYHIIIVRRRQDWKSQQKR